MDEPTEILTEKESEQIYLNFPLTNSSSTPFRLNPVLNRSMRFDN